MLCIDINVFAGNLLSRYQSDPAITRTIGVLRDTPLYLRAVPDFILTELELLITQVIPRRYRLSARDEALNRKTTAAYMHELSTTCTIVTPTAETVKAAFKLYNESMDSGYLSFTDTLLISVCKAHGYTLLSADKRLMKVAVEQGVACG